MGGRGFKAPILGGAATRPTPLLPLVLLRTREVGASIQGWDTEAEAVDWWSQALNSTSGCEGQEHRPWSLLLPGLDSWLHCLLAV